jgi:NAD(P)-dependent dehydrogenase (short-subunit alcohol dehydrogenase family)
MKLKPISEQVVVVVGASSGIGRETALRFAARRARVVAAARGERGLATLVDEIGRKGGEARAITADVLNFEDMKRVADFAAEHYGRIDTWVHLAAVSIYATFEQTTPEESKQIIDTNLTGQAYGALAALPHLRRAGGGALIHISSVEARRALPYQSAYAASKHGIKGFLDAMRMELEREGVRISVTEIMPSGINTPFFNKARTRLGVKPMPVKPIYQPSHVADAILYAAEHPVREIIVGGAGKMLALTERLSPSLANAALSLVAFEGQRTDEPKSEDAPDNLFRVLEGEGLDAVEGDFTAESRSFSLYTWLETHPVAKGIVTVGALGAAVLLAGRLFKNDDGTRRRNGGDRRGRLQTSKSPAT